MPLKCWTRPNKSGGAYTTCEKNGKQLRGGKKAPKKKKKKVVVVKNPNKSLGVMKRGAMASEADIKKYLTEFAKSKQGVSLPLYLKDLDKYKTGVKSTLIRSTGERIIKTKPLVVKEPPEKKKIKFKVGNKPKRVFVDGKEVVKDLDKYKTGVKSTLIRSTGERIIKTKPLVVKEPPKKKIIIKKKPKPKRPGMFESGMDYAREMGGMSLEPRVSFPNADKVGLLHGYMAPVPSAQKGTAKRVERPTKQMARVVAAKPRVPKIPKVIVGKKERSDKGGTHEEFTHNPLSGRKIRSDKGGTHDKIGGKGKEKRTDFYLLNGNRVTRKKAGSKAIGLTHEQLQKIAKEKFGAGYVIDGMGNPYIDVHQVLNWDNYN